MSAVDEDTELRDLLVQTLDKNGVLGKIKVFCYLEDSRVFATISTSYILLLHQLINLTPSAAILTHFGKKYVYPHTTMHMSEHNQVHEWR